MIRTELHTAAIGDALDRVNLRHQFLPPYLRPVDPGMVIVGRAMPVVEADIAGEGLLPGPDAPFGLMFDALDDLRPWEVYICSGASPEYALWGELMATRARRLGAAGAVVDGYSRDTRAILGLGFPVFSRGSYAQDQGPRGRVTDYRVPITIGQVRIEPGDIVFGDVDGVVVVPRAAEEEIVTAALEKMSGENLVRAAIQDGSSSADAFAKYGIM